MKSKKSTKFSESIVEEGEGVVSGGAGEEGKKLSQNV